MEMMETIEYLRWIRSLTDATIFVPETPAYRRVLNELKDHNIKFFRK